MTTDRRRTRTASASTKLKLAFASIGVVFGDIGTSPLYAMREALHPVVAAGGDLRAAVLGVASLLIWALILIVTLKYVVFLMRADNRAKAASSRSSCWSKRCSRTRAASSWRSA